MFISRDLERLSILIRFMITLTLPLMILVPLIIALNQVSDTNQLVIYYKMKNQILTFEYYLINKELLPQTFSNGEE